MKAVNLTRVIKMVLGNSLMLLVACSGGGGGSSSGTSGTPSVVSSASTTVSVGSSVPASVVNAVTEVVSPVGSSQLSSPLQIAITNSRDSFVLALDSTGTIRLAAMTSGGATTLSADSTALALVRMAIGGLPSGITANQANQAIRGAAEFPALVALIEGVLSSSLAPLESGPVVQSLATTVRQAMSTITAILVPPVPAASSAVAYASRSVEPSQLPHFNILSNVAGVFSVYVYSAGSDGSVNVVNASPITWSAHTLNETGTLIPAPSTDDGRILLHANTLSSSLLDIIHPWIGPRSVGLPGNEGKGLDIVVEQTQASRRENLVGILEVAFLEALPIAVSNECLRGGSRSLAHSRITSELSLGGDYGWF